jgi:Na+-translocating ferredoxin:NAD+ oxidoreductase subunit E
MLIETLQKITSQTILILVLGVVPLLAGASTMTTGMAIGGFFLAALIISNVIINIIRYLVPVEIRLVMIVLIAAIAVSMLQILMQTWFYDASQLLEIYIPLVAMNCLLLAMMNDLAMTGKFITVVINTSITGIAVLFLCTIIGAARQYINLPVIQGAPGVFLMLALVIILLNFMNNEMTTAGSAG